MAVTVQTNSRRHRSVRVSVWVVALTLVPMLGSGWFAYGEMRDVRDLREQASFVGRRSAELVRITQLQSAILDEGLHAAIVNGVGSLGVGRDLAIELLGVDSWTELDTTRAQVDEMIDELGLADLRASLAEVREPRDVSAITTSDRYEAITLAVHHRIDELHEVLLRGATEASGTAELVADLRALEYAAVARAAIAGQMLGQFSVLYSEPSETASEVQEIVVSLDRYDEAAGHLLTDVGTSDAVRQLLRAIHGSSSYEMLRASAEDAVSSILEGAVSPDPSMASMLVDMEHIAEKYRSGATTSAAHLNLVVAAGDEVAGAARSLENAADQLTRRALTTVGVLFLTALAFAFAVAAVIGRPLRRLADSVRRLSTGDQSVKLRPTGPTEVREAADALNEAVDNLQWAERQANALAAGRLDDPVLGERAPGAIGASLQEAVTTLTSSLAEREEFRRRLSHEASHDSLTQVANRRAVMTHLERSLARTNRSSSKLAVMFIDLDGFKSVNDLEGHAVGDAVLAAVARRLVNSVRQGDQVGRVGGDEFVVVAEPVEGVDDALRLARRILDQVVAPIATGEVSVSVGASIGIAIVDSESDLSADELLRDADLAVYKAKGQGRGQIVVCDEELRSELEERADLEHALRTAIAEDELTMYYQPIVASTNDEPVALEALVRWERPGFGLVPPDSFIPHAERSELIVDLDRWVLDAVARQMAQWTDHEVLGELPVAVNVSARHLGRADFVDSVRLALQTHGIDPRRLVVEVTESAVLHDLHHAGWALQELRTHGVRVAIDDFGTGYTSLSHLRALPVDILKIDRSFTSDPGAASLVQLIIDTGHLLGARVTSEGIETEEQATTLSTMGSDELQGFLFGRPVPAGQLETDHALDPA